MIGQTLNNRYKITSLLGEGGMGEVYLATDEQTGQQVAVKILIRQLTTQPDSLERFRREAETLQKLDHPNIVKFVDAFEHERQYVIVMIYIPGGSLHDLIKKGPLPVELTCQIALDLCDALIRSHRLNIIHRDLKPENVLLATDGTPKLADFGVARLSEGTRMTRSGTQVGTPYYMAPEAWEGKPLDAQADIWSLGVILFEMLTGQVPFAGDTGAAVMNKVLTTPPPDLKKLRAEVPSYLIKIIRQMLTRDKNRRYPTMREVAVELERGFTRDTGISGSIVGPSSADKKLSVGNIKGIATLIGAGAILIAVLLGFPRVSQLFQQNNIQTPQNTLQVPASDTTLISTSTISIPSETALPSSEVYVCNDVIGCLTVAPGEAIHVAYIQAVSGASAPLGQTNVNGAQLAIDDKGGELFGHPIRFDGEDSQCTREGGEAAGAKVTGDPTVVAILGTSCSSEARGAMPLVAEAGMVIISSSNTNPDLTDPTHADHHTGYFRTAYNDNFQGRLAAEFVYNKLDLRKAATVNDGSSYSQSLQQVFADVFTELGGTITTQKSMNVGDTDFRQTLASIAAGAPEIIFFPLFEPEGNRLASQKCEVSGLESVALMGADGLFTAGFASTTGSCAVGMYLSSPYVGGDAGAQFLAKYKAKFGEDPSSGYGPHAYDAMNVLFAAIEAVAQVDADGTVHIPRQALREALYGTKDFAGLTGSLSCDENGDCGSIDTLAVFQISQAMVNGADDLVTSLPVWPP